MKVRIFSALTMQEAMNQVKETLGRDAIILHTRKFRKGGIGGFFGREMIEVMAAVDNEIPMVTLSSTPATKPKAKIKKSSGVPVRSLIKPSVKSIKSAEEKSVAIEDENVNAKVEDEKSAYKDLAEKVSLAGMLQDNLEQPLQKDVAKAAPVLEPLALTRLITNKEDIPAPLISVKSEENIVSHTENDEGDLKSEISGMRQMLEQLLAKTKTVPNNQWYDYLVKKEILPAFAEQILKGFPYSLTMLNKNPEATKKMLYDRLVSYIRATEGIQLSKTGESKKIALVGPTGVGKTTTLAKLAARFTLDTNANVAFITSDTYRIAAVEQLKTYANILNIPLDVVYSPEEMRKSLLKHKDKQLILIDTAGRSQYNDEQMEELRELIEIDETIEPHLVLSSTTKHQDAVDVVEKFSCSASNRVIFTKIDEARNIGNIFNIMYEFPELSISYITDGQSVPDDIHPAQAFCLTDMLLRD